MRLSEQQPWVSLFRLERVFPSGLRGPVDMFSAVSVEGGGAGQGSEWAEVDKGKSGKRILEICYRS
jgi:hypothetical protein